MPVAGPSQFIESTLELEKNNIEKFVADWAAALFEAEIEILIAA